MTDEDRALLLEVRDLLTRVLTLFGQYQGLLDRASSPLFGFGRKGK